MHASWIEEIYRLMTGIYEIVILGVEGLLSLLRDIDIATVMMFLN